jgi:methyl-accepting chemotaxis protein
MLSRMKLSQRSLLPIALFALGIVLLTAVMIWQTRSVMVAERRGMVRSAVEIATTLAAGIDAEVTAGAISREEGRRRLIAVLGAIRFQGNEYYFVLDPSGVMLAHPNARLVGTNTLELRDANGVYLIRELIRAGLAGGDFVAYAFPRAGGTEAFPKLSYAGRISAFDVVVGTGVYVDDIDTATWRIAREISLAALLILVVAALASMLLVRAFVNPLNALGAWSRRVLGGEAVTEVPGLARGDEVGDLARAISGFRAQAERLAQADAERIALEERARASRAEIEEQLVAAVGAVVDAARMGDFSVKARSSASLGRLGALVDGLNAVTSACEAFLNEADDALGRLASGDLSARMDGDFDGRLAAVAANFNRAAEALSQTIDEVASAAAATRHAAGEIGGATRDLSSRTEQQAAALEETSASVEEIAKTVSVTAQTVDKASHGAQENAQRAEQGTAVAVRAVQAIDRVDAQAKKIVEIVGVMDGLSFQTNLLALNASVEAARAGDAGRGFAVVANEVRRLAQQSAEAARDVRQLITETNAHVDEGVALVKTVGDELGVISSTARDVAQTFAEIRQATREQSTGIDEIARALQQMDEMTQANAAAAEETATNARQLVGTAETLSALTGRFSGGSVSPVATRRRAA